MDLFKLGAAFSGAYLPTQVVEGYTSLIWTERFQQPGDFELKTPYIQEFLDLLPEMTFLSHKETREVMMVEDHEIGTNAEGVEELTIKGRSVDAFLEHRHVEGKYQKKRKTIQNYSPRGFLGLLLWNALDNNSGIDVTQADASMTTKDRVPNVMITESNVAGGDNRRWWLNEGPLYPQLMAVMERYDIGLRTLRPSHTNVTRVKVLTGPSVRGNIERDVVASTDALRFDIFQGVDRTLGMGSSSVVFSTRHGEILNAKYLFSARNYKTACEIMSGAGGSDQYRNATEQAYTGWQRRVMSHDAGEPDIPDDATNSEKDQIKAEFKEDAELDALRALRRTRRVLMLTGDIAPEAPYQFKTHYNLGDTVTLRGDYGVNTNMVVTEYVRTEDSEGDRGYPGLTLP